MAGQKEADCLIVGSGPTGLTLALELVRRGKSVRIFDRSPGPRPEDQSRALGILPPSLTILEPSGVTERLIDEGLQIVEARICQSGTFRFSIDISKAGNRFPFLTSLPQGRTERILIEALNALGVETEWSSQVTDIDDSGAQPQLTVERAGKVETATGKLIAGCDGVHSVVREKLGIAFDGDKLPTAFSLADVTLKEPDPIGVAIVDMGDNGLIARLPLPSGMVRLIGAFPDVEKNPNVKPMIGRLGWTSDFSIAFRHAEHLQKGRVFLAGDAAHVHSPAGGRGMNTGIGDAAWLAWLICEGRSSEYEKYRLPIARKIISQTRRLTNIATSTSGLKNVMVGRVMPVLMKLSWVQKRMAAQLLALDMPHPEWIDPE